MYLNHILLYALLFILLETDVYLLLLFRTQY